MNLSVPELILTATGAIALIALAVLRHRLTSRKKKQEAAEQKQRRQKQLEEQCALQRSKVRTHLPAVLQALQQFRVKII